MHICHWGQVVLSGCQTLHLRVNLIIDVNKLYGKLEKLSNLKLLLSEFWWRQIKYGRDITILSTLPELLTSSLLGYRLYRDLGHLQHFLPIISVLSSHTVNRLYVVFASPAFHHIQI